MGYGLKPIKLTGDGVAKVGRGKLHFIAITSDTTAATVTIYDNATEATGTVVFKATAVASKTDSHNIDKGMRFDDGLYVDFDAHTTEVLLGIDE